MLCTMCNVCRAVIRGALVSVPGMAAVNVNHNITFTFTLDDIFNRPDPDQGRASLFFNCKSANSSAQWVPVFRNGSKVERFMRDDSIDVKYVNPRQILVSIMRAQAEHAGTYRLMDFATDTESRAELVVVGLFHLGLSIYTVAHN